MLNRTIILKRLEKLSQELKTLKEKHVQEFLIYRVIQEQFAMRQLKVLAKRF